MWRCIRFRAVGLHHRWSAWRGTGITARLTRTPGIGTAAAKFWLHNRQGKHWQEKPVIVGDEERRPLFDLPRNEEEAQRIRDEKFAHWLPKKPGKASV